MTATLRGLPGVTGDRAAVYARSVTDAMRRIRVSRTLTAAGPTGAINVWRDDKGRLRSSFSRYRVTIDSAEHASLASLRRWLMAWWPQMHGELS